MSIFYSRISSTICTALHLVLVPFSLPLACDSFLDLTCFWGDWQFIYNTAHQGNIQLVHVPPLHQTGKGGKNHFTLPKTPLKILLTPRFLIYGFTTRKHQGHTQVTWNFPWLTLFFFFLLVSYMIFYMSQCHSPKSSHPLPLPQSP